MSVLKRLFKRPAKPAPKQFLVAQLIARLQPIGSTERLHMRFVVVVSVLLLMHACAVKPLSKSYSVTFSGTVMDAKTSQPVAGAFIQLESKNIQPLVRSITTSAADGTFSILVERSQLDTPIYEDDGDRFCSATATVAAFGYVATTKQFKHTRGTLGSRECVLHVDSWIVTIEKLGT